MKKKRLRLLYFIPVILWMAVIFWFSSNNGDISSMQSGKVSYMMASAVDKAFRLDMSEAERVGFSESISYLVRKLAHFTEYLVLGVLLYTAVVNNFGILCRLSRQRLENWENSKIAVFSPGSHCIWVCGDG